VPVLSDDGRVVGLVAARAEAPSLLTGLLAAPAPAAALVGVAVVLGVAGSLLLARRVRRQPSAWSPRRSWSSCSGGRPCCSA
jgi:sensor histidine kinase regulating citrate/malate metabolism